MEVSEEKKVGLVGGCERGLVVLATVIHPSEEVLMTAVEDISTSVVEYH